ncbi:MAG TPA: metalloregulator ArsR/SmtB family transcription factor [Ktedonobacterales bacterium]|jgi:DNA-binding transcriptional ArsR family regulator|nr:metalloregulator ArsR/SmtB family transcription factor [Ktedonobacterales bacterium]
MQLDKDDVIRLFTGLGDAMRLEIVFLLGEHERLNVGEIAAHFQLSRPAISHHLKVLKDARILKSQKRATEVYYWLDLASLSERLRAIVTLLEACTIATAAQESG